MKTIEVTIASVSALFPMRLADYQECPEMPTARQTRLQRVTRLPSDYHNFSGTLCFRLQVDRGWYRPCLWARGGQSPGYLARRPLQSKLPRFSSSAAITYQLGYRIWMCHSLLVSKEEVLCFLKRASVSGSFTGSFSPWLCVMMVLL